MKSTQRRLFTKNEIKTIVTLWEDSTTEQICNKVGRNKTSVMYIIKKARSLGVDLPKKRKIGITDNLVKETLS